LSIEDARRLFPGTREGIYLNVSVRGLLPGPVRDACIRYLDEKVAGREGSESKFAKIERARTGFARLINAEPDEIGIVKNVSEGLNAMAASLPWNRGDTLVLCGGVEHPNNVYPWYNLRDRLGVEIREVPSQGGRIPVGRLVEAADRSTRLVTVPTASFAPGFVTEVETLGRACRERGALLVVDAAQSVGVLETDVRELQVDALAVATQKALLALYGFGFLFVRRELAEELRPVALARYGVDLGEDAHETAVGPKTLRLARGARRFDLGNYNYLGATAAGASLDLLHQVGVPAIERHVRELSARLAQGFLDLGMPVCGGEPGPHLGHIVTVGELGGGDHYTADDPKLMELHHHLLDQGVRHSVRRGVLRFSLHLYNTADEVDRVLELVEGWQR
jgi:cysteine desulfurase/selenocysteine lyase